MILLSQKTGFRQYFKQAGLQKFLDLFVIFGDQILFAVFFGDRLPNILRM